MLFLVTLEGLRLFTELFVLGFQLLGQECDLTVFSRARLIQRLMQLLNLLIQLVLNLFSLLLLEQNLVFVVDFSLG